MLNTDVKSVKDNPWG